MPVVGLGVSVMSLINVDLPHPFEAHDADAVAHVDGQVDVLQDGRLRRGVLLYCGVLEGDLLEGYEGAWGSGGQGFRKVYGDAFLIGGDFDFSSRSEVVARQVSV